MSLLLRWPTLVAVAVTTLVCLLVSGPTKDSGGLEGAISWVTFIGFWAGLATCVALAVGLLGRKAIGR